MDIEHFVEMPIYFSKAFGFSRSLLALSLILSLLFNYDSVYAFKFEAALSSLPGMIKPSFLHDYNLLVKFDPEKFGFVCFLYILILITVIIGRFQGLTGLLLFYISWSYYDASYYPEGGDQLRVIISFLLVPISIFDSRKSHWESTIPVSRNRCFKLIIRYFRFLINVQISFMYFTAAVSKLSTASWTTGTALYYWMNHCFFGISSHGQFVLNLITYNSVTLLVSTYSVLMLELLLAGAIFSSNKYFQMSMLILGVVFHIMIGWMQGLIVFGLTVVACLLLYFEGVFVNEKQLVQCN